MKRIVQSVLEVISFLGAAVITWLLIRNPSYAVYIYPGFGACIMIFHLCEDLFLELLLLFVSIFIGLVSIILLPKEISSFYRIVLLIETLMLLMWYFLLFKLDTYLEKQRGLWTERKESKEKEISTLSVEINSLREHTFNSMIKIQNYKFIGEVINKLVSLQKCTQLSEYIVEVFSKLFPRCKTNLYIGGSEVDGILSYFGRDVIYLSDVSLSERYLYKSVIPVDDLEKIKSIIIIKLTNPKNNEVEGHLVVYSTESTILEDDFRLILLLSSYINIAITNIKMFEYVKQLAITDTLTGLFVQKYFKELLTEEIKLARYYNKPIILAMFDIDNFKQINDTYGHNVGDEVLIRFANILKTRLRETDVIARYGGDEFAVIFPNITVDDAKNVCEEIRSTVLKEAIVLSKYTNHTVHQLSTRVKFAISCGIGAYTSKFSSAEEFINYVDGLLYKAKQTGKNKIVAGV